MNLESITRAMLTRQGEVDTVTPTYQNPTWHISEHDGGYHITNDGKFNHLTKDALKVSPIAVYIADCNCGEDEIFDQTSVVNEDFDLESALNGTSPIWKLLEIIVQHDGLITLGFMDVQPDKYTVDADGNIENSNWETVTINADLEHLTMLVEAENGHRQYLIHQDYVTNNSGVVTRIIEIRDGLKVSRLFTEGENDSNGLPLWYGTVYEPGGDTPTDTSPNHHTDQPGA